MLHAGFGVSEGRITNKNQILTTSASYCTQCGTDLEASALRRTTENLCNHKIAFDSIKKCAQNSYQSIIRSDPAIRTKSSSIKKVASSQDLHVVSYRGTDEGQGQVG